MAKSGNKRTRRPGMPAAKSVVAEFTLTPPRPSATVSTTVGAVPVRTVYRVLRTNQLDEYDKPVPLEAIITGALGALAPASDNFDGTARKAAKLSIADAEIEEFDDLKELIDSLPSENAMKRHQPPITTTARSNRVKEEKRNVQIRGFLYAASRENDNDFHLIVGRDPGRPAMYMTMELSGLPPSNSKYRKTLKRARDDFKAFYRNQPNSLPGPTYDFYDPPIPMEIEGSLFFDMSHVKGGRPGPHDLRKNMPTIWEVHPVSRIVFEP